MLKLVNSLQNGLYQHLMESIDTDDDEVRERANGIECVLLLENVFS